MRSRMLILASCFALFATSCAANVARPRNDVGVTNLQGPDVTAETPGAEKTPQGPVVDPRSSEVASALVAGDYARVLALTDAPSNVPMGAWLDYQRASAFTGLGRTDEAVEGYQRAEARFRESGDDAGRSVAIWGRARALYEAGRCEEARAAYEEYAAFVRMRDPRGAEMAAAYSGTCRSGVKLR